MAKLIKGINDLATTNPELAREWHPTKNGDLLPNMITAGSEKKVWWIGKCGHEWQAMIANRNKGVGCPICSGQQILCGYNDLATTNPELAAEWHPAKNGDLTPDMVSVGSNKKVWWLGKCGHEWQAVICSRKEGYGCPFCANRKVLSGYNDLATTNPELAAEWHPTKNGDLTPNMLSAGSKKKVWWLGKCGHEWEAVVHSRNNESGCPICANQKVLAGYNDLTTTNPELVAEWHPTKNGDLTPSMVCAGSNKKVWWMCQNGHEWQATIIGRSSGYGCPICANQRILVGFNDLATVNPELANEWHPTKNGNLTPDMVGAGSIQKVWWKCSYGHEWQAIIESRNRGLSCPICAQRFHSSFPEQTILYYFSKVFSDTEGRSIIEGSSLELDVFIPSLKAAIEYDGVFWHASKASSEREKRKYLLCKKNGIKLIRVKEFISLEKPQIDNICDTLLTIASNPDYSMLDNMVKELFSVLNIQTFIEVNSRKDEKEIKGGYYLGRINNSLAKLNPNLAEEWHPTKNGSLLPDMVTASSSEKVWWLGKCGHEWEAVIGSRNSGIGCPICANQKILAGYNDLATTNPELAAEWHPTKNGNLLPSMVPAGSTKKVWWLGVKCGHEWQATVGSRNSGKGCPICANKKVLSGYNDLATTNPELAAEWHPTKNGDLTPYMVSVGSNKKVWWLGKCGHEWQTTIANRSKGVGCPICSSQQILNGYNDLATTNPELAAEWHPTKNGDLLPNMITAGSGKKIWWLGKCGHEWEATIYSRNSGRGCPYCNKSKKNNK